jgi:hypothetical protein
MFVMSAPQHIALSMQMPSFLVRAKNKRTIDKIIIAIPPSPVTVISSMIGVSMNPMLSATECQKASMA